MPLMPAIVGDRLTLDAERKNIGVGFMNGILYFSEPCGALLVKPTDELTNDQMRFISEIEEWTNRYGEGGAAYVGNLAQGYYASDGSADFWFCAHTEDEIVDEGSKLICTRHFSMGREYDPFTEQTATVHATNLTDDFDLTVTWGPERMTLSQPASIFEMPPFVETDAFDAWFLMQASFGEWWTIPVYSDQARKQVAGYLYYGDDGTFQFYNSMDVGEIGQSELLS